MTLVCYAKTTKDKIQLQRKPFASGGEGSLHRIKSPTHWRGMVAKIYHRPKRTKEREEKIALLIKHPPEEFQAGQWPSFVWPQDILLSQSGQFLGFVMPFVQGKKLELLCLPKLPKKLNANWQRLALDQKNSRDLRLRIAFNLSLAIYRMHQQDRYVLVDLKPENVILQSNGQLALVDMDSVQVHKNGQLKFMAPVATPEYSAPEYYQNPKPNSFKSSWDSFALAVILYKLLLGIHPYAASALPPHDQLVSLHQKIEAGLFVHHPEAKRLFKIIPPPHQEFLQLSTSLQTLFMHSFVEGHSLPELRPLAEEWCWAILEELKDPELKQRFQQMLLQQDLQFKRLRRPSDILPPLEQLEKKWSDYLPQDYKMALAWQMPQLQYPKSVQQINIQSNMDSWGNFILSIIATIVTVAALLNSFPAIYQWMTRDLLQYPFWQIMLIIQGFFAFPILIFPFTLHGIHLLINPQRLKWKTLKKNAQAQQKKLDQWHKKLEEAKTNLLQVLKTELPNFQTLETTSKAIKQSYLEGLQKLDSAFEKLLAQEQEHKAYILAPILTQLQKELPLLSPAHDFKSALEILRKAEQDQLIDNQQEELGQDFHQFKAMAQKEKRLAFERLATEEKHFLSYIQEQREVLQDRQKQDIQAQHDNLSRFNNLKIGHKQHLHLRAREGLRLILKLNKAGFHSMSQLKEINIPKAQLIFKDGRTLNLSDFSQSDVNMAHRFMIWLQASYKEERLFLQELQRIDKFYAKEREKLEEKTRLARPKFAKRKADLQQQARDAFLAQKAQNIRQAYQQKRQQVRQAQQMFNKKMQAILDERSPLYQTLEEEAKQLHKKHKEQLDNLKHLHQHKLHLQLQEEKHLLRPWAPNNLTEIETILQKKAKLEQQLSAYKS
ncbi:serine/threonine protein kinase [Saprospira sp. CCB-QB6]|uniref:protein kinase domain-containing protein n=1 Tax=Saprospira sp. CCB-QB6 TaxID=3023936 RepID=UPI002349C07B|nr:serine/threonine protein kinase [Saprospira sp. CCB-QB6]WCL81806.1 serine/threonine protein kinase [Saprospira sp. CCB-QB6]